MDNPMNLGRQELSKQISDILKYDNEKKMGELIHNGTINPNLTFYGVPYV